MDHATNISRPSNVSTPSNLTAVPSPSCQNATISGNEKGNFNEEGKRHCRQRSFLLFLFGGIGILFIGVILIGLAIAGVFSPTKGDVFSSSPSLEEMSSKFIPDFCYEEYTGVKGHGETFKGNKANQNTNGNSEHQDLIWTSQENGQISINGETFLVKGVSWSGCESSYYIPAGLTKGFSTSRIMDWMMNHKFNTLRIPFSVEMVLQPLDKLPPSPRGLNEDLSGLTIFEIVEQIIDDAGERGIMVVLDMHYLGSLEITELWYNKEYSEKDVFDAWDRLMQLYSQKWNVFALDLKNEPHGKSSWGTDSPETDVNKFYERLITHLLAKFPDYTGLFMVEGTQNYFQYKAQVDTIYPFWWGQNFLGAKSNPIEVADDPKIMFRNINNEKQHVNVNDRIIYSPHVYGPSVFNHTYFYPEKETLKESLYEVWDYQMGWLGTTLNKGIIIGEWGGPMSGLNAKVLDILAEYLQDRCMSNNIWWSLNPESHDTGGIISSDWNGVEEDKLKLLDKIVPTPSALLPKESKGLCVKKGNYAIGKQCQL